MAANRENNSKFFPLIQFNLFNTLIAETTKYCLSRPRRFPNKMVFLYTILMLFAHIKQRNIRSIRQNWELCDAKVLSLNFRIRFQLNIVDQKFETFAFWWGLNRRVLSGSRGFEAMTFRNYFTSTVNECLVAHNLISITNPFRTSEIGCKSHLKIFYVGSWIPRNSIAFGEEGKRPKIYFIDI